MLKKVFLLLTHPIFRKFMLALTGTFLTFFLCTHLAGNYLVFGGAEILNAYSAFLHSIPLLLVIEIVLFSSILYHAAIGVYFRFFDGTRARERGYVKRANAPKSRRNIASRWAHWTGMIIFAFLIYHVWDMKHARATGYENDIFSHLILRFSSPWVVLIYTVAILALGLHLFHGLGTLYESYGIAHRSYLRRLGQGFALILFILYLALPLSIYLYGASL